MSLALVASLTACFSTDETVISGESAYVVLEVTPLEGEPRQGSGRGPARLAMLDFVPERRGLGAALAAEGFPHDCARGACDQLLKRRGAFLLEFLGSAGLGRYGLRDWKPGESREVSGSQLLFTNLLNVETLRLTGTEEAPARARLTMLKRCEAKVLYIEDASFGGRDYGMINLPTSVTRRWVELKRPTCFEERDLELTPR